MEQNNDVSAQTIMKEEFATEFQTFLGRVRDAVGLAHFVDSETPTIDVDEAVRSIAGFYERTRNTLEYGERDFLRQRAIERTLKRILNFGSSLAPDDLAGELLRELIRAGYFPNERLPETAALPVGAVLQRLSAGVSAVSALFHDELIRCAAFEIEDIVFPERAAAQAAIVAFVMEICESRLRWPQEARADRGHRAFLFAAAHRAVLKANSSRIIFSFLRDALPQWRNADPEEIAALSEEFERVLMTAKRTIAHPRSEQYARALRRFAPAFRAIDDAVSDRALSENDGGNMTIMQLERLLEEVVAKHCGEAKRKLRTAAWRATLYVFFTKMVVGLSIEIPYDYFFTGAVFTQAFFINLAFPPALMFLVAFSARPPRLAVADRIVDDAMRIATGRERLGHVRLPRERGAARLAAFGLATMVFGGGALFFIFKGLSALSFSPFGMVIFFIFLSIVSLFAWRVRRPLRDLAVRSGGGVAATLIEVLVFPFLAVGRVMSDGLRSVNVFIFLLDVFIESPLKMLFAVFEDWLAFLREKREKLAEE